MARWILSGILALLVLWPGSAGAQWRPNALEVGAFVATCMHQARSYSPGDGVELHGNVHEATLVDRMRPFAILRTRTPDSSDEAPVSFEALTNSDPYHQEALRAGVVCFNGMIYP